MAAAPFDAPLERLLTPFDRALLREHRRSLLSIATGRVLELGTGWGAQIELYPALRVEDVTLVGAATRTPVGRRATRAAFDVHQAASLDELDPPYDTIVAVFVLSARRDLGADLAVLRALLDPDGRLLFLDTSRRRPPGVTTLLTTTVTRPALRVLGPAGPDAPDLPAALRRAGLVVSDLERFGLPTLTLPLRSLVKGAARPKRPRPRHESPTAKETS